MHSKCFAWFLCFELAIRERLRVFDESLLVQMFLIKILFVHVYIIGVLFFESFMLIIAI